jgi:hypothetical protein
MIGTEALKTSVPSRSAFLRTWRRAAPRVDVDDPYTLSAADRIERWKILYAFQS